MSCCEHTQPLFDCWSDDGGSGKPCRPCVVRGPPLYSHDNASDSSLHSCNSVNALKQWTASTVCGLSARCPVARCCMAPRSSKKRRSRSAEGDGERRNGSSDLLDACGNYNRCTYIQNRYHLYCYHHLC